MCLALPAKVVSIDDSTDIAIVSMDGVKIEISLELVEQVSVGDYVLVHVGYALNIISVEEAHKTLALFAEADLLEQT